MKFRNDANQGLSKYQSQPYWTHGGTNRLSDGLILRLFTGCGIDKLYFAVNCKKFDQFLYRGQSSTILSIFLISIETFCFE